MKNKFLNFWTFMIVAFIGVSVSMTSCKPEDEDPIVVPVEDGMYLKGAATTFTDLNDKMAMFDGRIEGAGFSANLREGMFEKFVYLKAGEFSIVEKAGATETVYGGAAMQDSTLAGQDAQINGTFKIGTLEDGAAAFSVATEGLYHIVVDKSAAKVAVIPVTAWAVVGDATPAGWSAELPLTKTTLDATGGSWKIEGVELRTGSFKFRYNDGWKVTVAKTATDTVVSFSNVGKGATDADWIMGGGGWPIAADAQGFYTIEFKWDVENNFSYTLTKTGDLAMTNWTDVVVDMIGEGVSSENTNAFASTTWDNWGFTLLADNNGKPTKSGNVYSWTWSNIKLVENKGFKVRTKDGVAPANGNGANFDGGLNIVDHAASSPNVNPAVTGDITVTTAGNYTLTLTVDAGNYDAKVLKIVAAK